MEKVLDMLKLKHSPTLWYHQNFLANVKIFTFMYQNSQMCGILLSRLQALHIRMLQKPLSTEMVVIYIILFP